VQSFLSRTTKRPSLFSFRQVFPLGSSSPPGGVCSTHFLPVEGFLFSFSLVYGGNQGQVHFSSAVFRFKWFFFTLKIVPGKFLPCSRAFSLAFFSNSLTLSLSRHLVPSPSSSALRGAMDCSSALQESVPTLFSYVLELSRRGTKKGLPTEGAVTFWSRYWMWMTAMWAL